MNCQQIKEQLGLYVDGELAVDAKTHVEAHLASCDACSCELRTLQELAGAMSRCEPICVPTGLWTAIENGLKASDRTPRYRSMRFRVPRIVGIAAAVLIAVLGGYALLQRGPDFATPAQAATVDFGVLLDHLATDPRGAFDRFVSYYHAKPATVAAAKTHAPKLNFDVPETLPGDFRLESVYTLDFGGSPGVAARYSHNGEFLGALFHPPVLKEDFGTHRDYDCIVGQHRGHSVEVGGWRLVHLTDATTCHCILSRLDPIAELPAVMAAVAPQRAPGSDDQAADSHEHRP